MWTLGNSAKNWWRMLKFTMKWGGNHEKLVNQKGFTPKNMVIFRDKWVLSFNRRMGGFPILRQPRSSNQLGSSSRLEKSKCHQHWQHVESHGKPRSAMISASSNGVLAMISVQKKQVEVAASSYGTRCLRDFLTLKLPVQRKCWTKCDWQMLGFCRAWSTSGEDSNIP